MRLAAAGFLLALVLLTGSALHAGEAPTAPGLELVIAGLSDHPPSSAKPESTPAESPGNAAAIREPPRARVGLNKTLWVLIGPIEQIDAAGPLDSSRFVLYFNGQQVTGIDPPNYDPGEHALLFKLSRSKDNETLWKDLLGSPTHATVPVTVALGLRPAAGELGAQASAASSPPPSIRATGVAATFDLEVFSITRLAIAVIAITLVLALVWGHARNATTLRDDLLPQIPPRQQPYSLGRWQMAFWFTLIFASFVFLFLLLWDANTISAQALGLMGISSATALAAVAVDVAKNSPADAVNQGLRALGLNSYDDVLRVKREIIERQAALAASPFEPRKTQLTSEITDRELLIRTYEDKTRPFLTQGWFRDMTTDLNGTALHRLQSFCWTWALGVVFLISVYRDLAMYEFNPTLLALMGISGAGYIGFKIPEANS